MFAWLYLILLVWLKTFVLMFSLLVDVIYFILYLSLFLCTVFFYWIIKSCNDPQVDDTNHAITATFNRYIYQPHRSITMKDQMYGHSQQKL